MDIKMSTFHLGTMIIKFELPMVFIDDINKAYDKHNEQMPAHNQELAGKIADEKRTNQILTTGMIELFEACFNEYLRINVVQ